MAMLVITRWYMLYHFKSYHHFRWWNPCFCRSQVLHPHFWSKIWDMCLALIAELWWPRFGQDTGTFVSTSYEMIWRAGYQDELWSDPSDPYPDRWVCLQNWQDIFLPSKLFFFFCNLLVTHVSFLGKFDPNLLREMINIAIRIVIIVAILIIVLI